jgi:hypothetical protein
MRRERHYSQVYTADKIPRFLAADGLDEPLKHGSGNIHTEDGPGPQSPETAGSVLVNVGTFCLFLLSVYCKPLGLAQVPFSATVTFQRDQQSLNGMDTSTQSSTTRPPSNCCTSLQSIQWL